MPSVWTQGKRSLLPLDRLGQAASVILEVVPYHLYARVVAAPENFLTFAGSHKFPSWDSEVLAIHQKPLGWIGKAGAENLLIDGELAHLDGQALSKDSPKDRGGGKANKNFEPAASDDTVDTTENQDAHVDVLRNDSDKNGDTLMVVAINDVDISVGETQFLASGAAVTLRADGSLNYDPFSAFDQLRSGETATDELTYTVADGRGGLATALLSVTVHGIDDYPESNTSPDAVDDVYFTGESGMVSGDLLANDSDPDGDPLTIVGVNGVPSAVGTMLKLASGASLIVAADGSFTYDAAGSFDALDGGETATDRFSYTVSDGAGGSTTAWTTVTIEGESSPSDEVGAPPYYVMGLLAGADKRVNYPDAYGTPDVVTYAFAQETPGYYAIDSSFQDGFKAFSLQQQDQTRAVLNDISEICNLQFQEVAIDQAEMVFGIADIGFSGFAFFPSSNGVGCDDSDVWLDDGTAGSAFVPGTTGHFTLIHEIGHALGLAHPDLPLDEDNQQNSVMSYNGHPTMGPEPTTYMPYDIAALQYLYGSNTLATSGDDIYAFSNLADQVQTIWDAGGQDTIDLSAAPYGIVLNLTEGSCSTITTAGSDNLAIAFGTKVEQAIGTDFADVIHGNAAANTLRGGAGDDVMRGGGGADTFVFGPDWGHDVIEDFENGVDVAVIEGVAGNLVDISFSVTDDGLIASCEGNSILFEAVFMIDEADFLFI